MVDFLYVNRIVKMMKHYNNLHTGPPPEYHSWNQFCSRTKKVFV